MTEFDLIGFLHARKPAQAAGQPEPNSLGQGEAIPRGLIVPGLPWSDPQADPYADILAFRDGALARWQPPAPQPDLAERFRTELVRLTMETFERAVWDPNAIVTQDEARDVVTAIDAEHQRAEQIMANIQQWADKVKDFEPQKIVMSSAHLAAVKEAIPAAPAQPTFGLGMSQLLATPVKVDDTVRWPRLEPLHRKLKRSDVTTRILLDHVAEHRGWAWEALCRLFPPKVVLAAIMREVDNRRLDYGVAARRPFLTAAGERWLRDNPKDPA